MITSSNKSRFSIIKIAGVAVACAMAGGAAFAQVAVTPPVGTVTTDTAASGAKVVKIQANDQVVSVMIAADGSSSAITLVNGPQITSPTATEALAVLKADLTPTQLAAASSALVAAGQNSGGLSGGINTFVATQATNASNMTSTVTQGQLRDALGNVIVAGGGATQADLNATNARVTTVEDKTQAITATATKTTIREGSAYVVVGDSQTAIGDSAGVSISGGNARINVGTSVEGNGSAVAIIGDLTVTKNGTTTNVVNAINSKQADVGLTKSGNVITTNAGLNVTGPLTMNNQAVATWSQVNAVDQKANLTNQTIGWQVNVNGGYLNNTNNTVAANLNRLDDADKALSGRLDTVAQKTSTLSVANDFANGDQLTTTITSAVTNINSDDVNIGKNDNFIHVTNDHGVEVFVGDGKAFKVNNVAVATVNNVATAKTEAITAAKGYTDGKVTQLQGEIATAKTEAITAANSYTDGRIGNIGTKTVKSYVDDKAAETLGLANDYTNRREAAIRGGYTGTMMDLDGKIDGVDQRHTEWNQRQDAHLAAHDAHLARHDQQISVLEVKTQNQSAVAGKTTFKGEVVADVVTAKVANIGTANIDKAIIKTADITVANIETANVKTANIETANVKTANIVTANVKTANIEVANVGEANIKTANIDTANVKDAFVQRATIGTLKVTGDASVKGSLFVNGRSEDVASTLNKHEGAIKVAGAIVVNTFLNDSLPQEVKDAGISLSATSSSIAVNKALGDGKSVSVSTSGVSLNKTHDVNEYVRVQGSIGTEGVNVGAFAHVDGNGVGVSKFGASIMVQNHVIPLTPQGFVVAAVSGAINSVTGKTQKEIASLKAQNAQMAAELTELKAQVAAILAAQAAAAK